MRRCWLILGAVLLLSSVALTAAQRHHERQIAQRTAALLPQTDGNAVIATPLTAQQEAPPVFAALHIPSLKLTLPVQDLCSEALLELSPCRYAGSAETDDLVVAGHNYAAHFGALHRLQAGDAVCYTALDGTQYHYRVVSVQVLSAAAVEEMTESDADLTLFTCTAGGKRRLTVRCQRME